MSLPRLYPPPRSPPSHPPSPRAPTPPPSVHDHGLHVDFDMNFDLGPNPGPYESSTSVITCVADRNSTGAAPTIISSSKHTSYRVSHSPSAQSHSQPHTQSPPPRPNQLHHPLQPTLVLENCGSVARDHLASERTFLAYIRTSLAIASTGVALVQLFSISAASSDGIARNVEIIARPLGATTMAFALCVLFVGFTRYFSVQSAMTRGVFPVARWTVAGIALTLGALVSIVFALSLQSRRGTQA